MCCALELPLALSLALSLALPLALPMELALEEEEEALVRALALREAEARESATALPFCSTPARPATAHLKALAVHLAVARRGLAPLCSSTLCARSTEGAAAAAARGSSCLSSPLGSRLGELPPPAPPPPPA